MPLTTRTKEKPFLLQTLIGFGKALMALFGLCDLVGMCVKLEQSPDWITAFYSTWAFYGTNAGNS